MKIKMKYIMLFTMGIGLYSLNANAQDPETKQLQEVHVNGTVKRPFHRDGALQMLQRKHVSRLSRPTVAAFMLRKREDGEFYPQAQLSILGNTPPAKEIIFEWRQFVGSRSFFAGRRYLKLSPEGQVTGNTPLQRGKYLVQVLDTKGVPLDETRTGKPASFVINTSLKTPTVKHFVN